MNLHDRFKYALARCSFPGMEEWRFEIRMHQGEFGLHKLMASRTLPNSDDVAKTFAIPRRDNWKKYDHKRVNPGEQIEIYDFCFFYHQDEYPPDFFEKMIFHIYLYFSIHEHLESFKVDGVRRYNPHDKAYYSYDAQSMGHTFDKGLRRRQWRNSMTDEFVHKVMSDQPTLTLLEKIKVRVWDIRQAIDKWVQSVLSTRWHRSPIMAKLEITCVTVNRITHTLFGRTIGFFQRLEEWCIDKRDLPYTKLDNKEAA